MALRSLKLTRASVAAGDDADAPHFASVQIDESWTILPILEEILRINYLPQIFGGAASWSVSHTQPVAIIAQQWDQPRLIELPDFPYHGTPGYVHLEHLHFNYHTQLDPDTVYAVLREYSSPRG